MSDTKHTRGPWTFHQAAGSLYATLRAGGRLLAIFRQAPSDEDGRLIAAAPDMLAALKSFIVYVETDDRDDTAKSIAKDIAETKARAAIAKATGE